VNTGPSRVALVEEVPNCSDYLLARAAASGSTSAIRDLYGRHHERVYALCLRMTRNSADAEDLTQEVFVRVMRTVGSFRGESRFSTWLHRLTVNSVLMQFRHRKARPETRLSDIFEPNISTMVRDQQPHTARIMDRIALHSAIAQLAPGCRSVFVLFAVEGYQHPEIARLMGCSIGTSKSQLHRARKNLKRLLRTRSK
jgi:RNA polymerase sigma-70 factor, ECF subfamily